MISEILGIEVACNLRKWIPRHDIGEEFCGSMGPAESMPRIPRAGIDPRRSSRSYIRKAGLTRGHNARPTVFPLDRLIDIVHIPDKLLEALFDLGIRAQGISPHFAGF